MKKYLAALAVFVVFFTVGSYISTYMGGPSISGVIKQIQKKDKVLLLIGVDARNKNEPSRSDTIILAFFHPKLNRVDTISIPRDSRVDIPGEDRKRKINFAHAKGGVELLEETLDQQFGVKPDRYIEIDFEGFEKAIDTLGGVEINVEKRMYYPEEGINVHKGLQTLDGHDALGYVRYRSDGLGDIGRVERQQKFLRALARQFFTGGGILKAPSLYEEIKEYVKTDVEVSDITSFARQFAEDPQVNSYMVPGEAQMISGGSYWVVDWDKTKKLIEQLKSGQDPQTNTEEKPDGSNNTSK
ncbi:MAG: LCP family protein [Candidatus Saccharibacteria bacterium]